MKADAPRAGARLRARWAVSGVFFVSGVLLASWVAYLPIVQQRLELSEADLGGALFAMTAGALAGVVAAGGLIERFGSREVVAVSGGLFCLLLPAPVFSPSFWMLAASLAAFGIAFGAINVAMNAQAATVQRAAGQPLMSSFHGLYSLGGLAGSVVAGLVLWFEVAPERHMLGVVAVMLGLCTLSAIRLLARSEGERSGGPAVALPLGPLVGLSVLCFLIFVGEGAVIDWSNVYLANVVRVDPGRAVFGFAAFSTMMAIGRFLGDAATLRIGSMRFAIASAALAAGGLGLALATARFPIATAGFGVAGLGFANLVPILFTRAAEATPDAPQKGIAGVAGVGYFGLVAGPPVIGFAAEAMGLRGALALVAGAMALVAMSLGLGLGGVAHPGGPRQ